MTDPHNPHPYDDDAPAADAAGGLAALQAEVDAERARMEVDADHARDTQAWGPGWYQDPADRATIRYWDGRQWVGPALPAGVPAPPPGVEPAPQPAVYPLGCTTAPLGDDGDVVHVLPVDDWRTRATSSLRSGDFDAWAEVCLAGDDYEDVWLALNDGQGPTLGQVTAMFEAHADITGQSSGKSARSRGSSRATRRR